MRMSFNGPRKPRAAIGLAALAMTAITMAALVVLPAWLETAEVERNPAVVAHAASVPLKVAIVVSARGGPSFHNPSKE